MSNLTQRYLKNNRTAATVRERPSYLCSRQGGWVLGVSAWRVSGGGGVRLEECGGSPSCWLRGHWSLPWLDIVKRGQTAEAVLSRNAAALSVLEELETLAKKSKRLRTRHGGAPCAPCFSCPGFTVAGRFKAELQIPKYYSCHDTSNLRHRSPLFYHFSHPSQEGSDGFKPTNDDACTVTEEAKSSWFVQVLPSWT